VSNKIEVDLIKFVFSIIILRSGKWFVCLRPLAVFYDLSAT